MNECRLNFYLFWLCWVFIAVKGLCYPEVYTILVPQPGMEPAPPAAEAWRPNHWTARDVPGPPPTVQNDLPQEGAPALPVPARTGLLEWLSRA